MKERVETNETEEFVKCYFNNAVFYVSNQVFSEVLLKAPHHSNKNYVRYKEGAELYGMSERKFVELAKNADAIRRIDKMVLVSTEAINKYIEFNNQ